MAESIGRVGDSLGYAFAKPGRPVEMAKGSAGRVLQSKTRFGDWLGHACQ